MSERINADHRDQPVQVTKIMSLSIEEFRRSLRHMAADQEIDDNQSETTFASGSGTATVSYKSLSPISPGGLLKLPRGEVTICFDKAKPADRQSFLGRFDTAFRRGGG